MWWERAALDKEAGPTPEPREDMLERRRSCAGHGVRWPAALARAKERPAIEWL